MARARRDDGRSRGRALGPGASRAAADVGRRAGCGCCSMAVARCAGRPLRSSRCWWRWARSRRYVVGAEGLRRWRSVVGAGRRRRSGMIIGFFTIPVLGIVVGGCAAGLARGVGPAARPQGRPGTPPGRPFRGMGSAPVQMLAGVGDPGRVAGGGLGLLRRGPSAAGELRATRRGRWWLDPRRSGTMRAEPALC